jgi:hypothetical protein
MTHELREGKVFNDLRIREEDDRRVLRNTLAKLQDIPVCVYTAMYGNLSNFISSA